MLDFIRKKYASVFLLLSAIPFIQGCDIGTNSHDSSCLTNSTGRSIARGVPDGSGNLPVGALYGTRGDQKYVSQTMLSYKCTATLLRSSILITAAHCSPQADVKGERYFTLEDLGQEASSDKMIRVTTSEIHPDLKFGKVGDWDSIKGPDLAILELAQPVSSVCGFPEVYPKRVFDRAEGMVVGFGETERTKVGLKRSAMVEVELKSLFYIDGMEGIGQSMLAHHSPEGPSLCLGDSGSPLLFGTNIAGIASTADFKNSDYTCGKSYQSTFVALAPFIEWISATVDKLQQ